MINLFEGVVTEVAEDSFCATLIDIVNSDYSEEEEIEFSRIKKSERDFICEGAVFYWFIKAEYGISEIVFRKKKWTQEQIVHIIDEGKKLYDKVNSNDSPAND